MSNLTTDSPAERLYVALHNISGKWLRDEKKLTSYLAVGLQRLAAEHERIVAERLAVITAERDAAIAERDQLARLAAENAKLQESLAHWEQLNDADVISNALLLYRCQRDAEGKKDWALRAEKMKGVVEKLTSKMDDAYTSLGDGQ